MTNHTVGREQEEKAEEKESEETRKRKEERNDEKKRGEEEKWRDKDIEMEMVVDMNIYAKNPSTCVPRHVLIHVQIHMETQKQITKNI